MSAKRQSAFTRALREAQPPDEPPAPLATPPIADEVLAPPLVQAQHAEQKGPLVERNRGGRPRSPIAKKKFTFYLDATSDETITAIKKALVRHADQLIEEKGTVVEHALRLMRFGLEDAKSRDAFLEIYEQWLLKNS